MDNLQNHFQMSNLRADKICLLPVLNKDWEISIFVKVISSSKFEQQTQIKKENINYGRKENIIYCLWATL